MISISLCMIVKNEASSLKRCLLSLKDIVDEIIIIDTGSTDNTKEIAHEFTTQIYDFRWNDDFSEARNFSFSFATKDYIYCADADEVLDEANKIKFLQLKQVLLPEIELVQMKYVTKTDFNTVLNAKKEYRPKLFKRLRTFTWIDPIHETIRLEPIVYDSDIEIFHMPASMHQKRDFQTFLRSYEKNHMLSNKVRSMYARELMICGTKEDFCDAKPVFFDYLSSFEANEPSNAAYAKEATCILLKTARLSNDFAYLLQYSLNDLLTTPSSEACLELGLFFMEQGYYEQAILWFYNAAFETSSILNIRSQGNLPLNCLSECYHHIITRLNESLKTADKEQFLNIKAQIEEYSALALSYEQKAASFELPEEL